MDPINKFLPAACRSLAVRTCFSVRISSSVFFSSAFHSSLCLSCSSALSSWKSRPMTESVGELMSCKYHFNPDHRADFRLLQTPADSKTVLWLDWSTDVHSHFTKNFSRFVCLTYRHYEARQGNTAVSMTHIIISLGNRVACSRGEGVT